VPDEELHRLRKQHRDCHEKEEDTAAMMEEGALEGKKNPVTRVRASTTTYLNRKRDDVLWWSGVPSCGGRRAEVKI